MNLKNIKGQDVVLGQLSDDFLRIDNDVDGSNRSSSSLSNATQNQIESDGQLALNLQRQYNLQTSSSMFGNEWFANYRAELSITFIEAHLVKNYGLMNMNVYVRMRVGNTIYETKNSNRGGKNPKWGETCCVYLPNGIDTVAIELYDDCLFTQDDLIAWATFTIPEEYLTFTETVSHNFEKKIILSGKQGENQEGEIFIAFNTKPISSNSLRTYLTTPVYAPQPAMILANPPILTNPLIVHQSPVSANTLLGPTVTQSQSTDTVPQTLEINEQDLQNLKDIFPKIETEIIKSVLINANNNVEQACTNLLELNTTT
ncbi:Toll-interacting protein A [Sarcoptes scabiei]|nr:Toll-interacting protein A [Sarcoptes scabiei]